MIVPWSDGPFQRYSAGNGGGVAYVYATIPSPANHDITAICFHHNVVLPYMTSTLSTQDALFNCIVQNNFSVGRCHIGPPLVHLTGLVRLQTQKDCSTARCIVFVCLQSDQNKTTACCILVLWRRNFCSPVFGPSYFVPLSFAQSIAAYRSISRYCSLDREI